MQNKVGQALAYALIGRPYKPSATGRYYCCPVCTLRGQPRPDRRFRCGIRDDGDIIKIHCFNCHLKTGYHLGSILGYNVRTFLEQLGVPSRDVKYLGLWAEQKRLELAHDPRIQEQFQATTLPQFNATLLPPETQSIETWADLGCNDPDYLDTIAYLLSRGETAATATTYYWTPETEHDLHRRLIIPCYQHGRVVGWTARSITEDIQPRYHKQTPSNLLFNIDLLNAANRYYIFIVEGVFDALVIDGVGALGGSLNEQQIGWINQTDRQPIVVPDRDRAGSYLIDIAITQGWPVATPHYGKHQWWDADVKDAADAVLRYGKLYTLQSIVATLTYDAGQIRQRTSYQTR